MEEKVFIQNEKGLKLAAVIHNPEKTGRFPAIILLHGFTGYKEEKHIETLAKDLANAGFVAIRFDSSGFGESEGTIENDFRFSNYLSDIEYIYKFLIKKENVDPNRIGIWGHSMGGMLSVVFAAEHPEIKAACAISAPVSMKNVYSSEVENWRKKGYIEKVCSKNNQTVKIPYRFLEDVNKCNVLDFIQKLYMPLFVVLGLSDDTVLPVDTKLIFDKANQPKRVLEVQGMTHDYKNYPEFIKTINKAVIDFFSKNM